MEDTLIQESWWKRNWKWVVPVGCGVFFIVGIILVVGGVIWGVLHPPFLTVSRNRMP